MILNILLLIIVFSEVCYAFALAAGYVRHPQQSVRTAHLRTEPGVMRLDPRLPVQTIRQQTNFTNVNAKFGSRLSFAISPGNASVRSGTGGLFHDNIASYIVGVAPDQRRGAALFHMGTINKQQGDSYVQDERWIQGLNTTRWLATADQSIRVTVDIIDPFLGTPGCTDMSACLEEVKADIAPIFIVGITLQNISAERQAGRFLFGSNRKLASTRSCAGSLTPGGTAINTLSYDPTTDVAGGTLFLAGDRERWQCNTSLSDRVGLSWSYRLSTKQQQTAYLILGGWNARQSIFINTQLPQGCQHESLYPSVLWSSPTQVAHFAIDNLATGSNLLGRAQTMEDYLVQNKVLMPEQRWLLGQALRSYKASSWLLARPACAGGGYDAAVYEGTFGFLTTVDVLHEYGYFEITRVPWFFKAALTTVFKNATHNALGTYFQHDQGGNLDTRGRCTEPGKGTPTLRSTCYAPPHIVDGAPMPTEENANVALLMAYYIFVTQDIAFLKRYMALLEAAMAHNLRVGDPTTGIAYRSQDTKTTYDAASDCLHNASPGAGNLYYQGIKEAAAYRATAYLAGRLSKGREEARWLAAAGKIEDAIVRAYRKRGYLPLADNTALSNCAGRTVVQGEGLFYLHLIGKDKTVNPELLRILAGQYTNDLKAVTLTTPPMIALTSTMATGPQCDAGHCRRYTWFSKVLLSGLIADLIYTRYGCTSCTRLNLVQAAYTYNVNSPSGFRDGFRDDGSDWQGHFYPRGLIAWSWLSTDY
jgi:hypothetical protein